MRAPDAPHLNELPDWLTVPEFAAWARVGLGVAYQMLREERVYACRFKKQLRIPKTECERMLRGGAPNGNA